MQGTKQQVVAENLLLCFNAAYVFLVLLPILFPKRFHPMFPALCLLHSQPLKSKKRHKGVIFNFMVGMTGLEPATSSSRTKRSTRLNYIPSQSAYKLSRKIYFASRI